MFTQKQEEYLAALADEGEAEQVATEARNAEINLAGAVDKARHEKRQELEISAQVLIDEGMQQFEVNIVPTIEVK